MIFTKFIYVELRLSHNVLALANPKGLSGANAERVGRLSLAGLSAELASLLPSSADRGLARCA